MLTMAFPAFAGNIYCTVVGVKQGKFQSDASLRSASTGIAVYALTEDIKVPFDASSGQGSGRAQNSPVTIVKELDASSPQFFEAAVTNERLTSVACTFHRTTGGEPMRAYYKITLTNASVVEVKDSGDGVNGWPRVTSSSAFHSPTRRSRCKISAQHDRHRRLGDHRVTTRRWRFFAQRAEQAYCA